MEYVKALPLDATFLVRSWVRMLTAIKKLYPLLETDGYGCESSGPGLSVRGGHGVTTPVSFAMQLFNPLGVRSYRESRAVL